MSTFEFSHTIPTGITELIYDYEADALYLCFGKPGPAVTRDVGGDVLMQTDPASGEVVGMTILNLARQNHRGGLRIQVASRKRS